MGCPLFFNDFLFVDYLLFINKWWNVQFFSHSFSTKEKGKSFD
ncbi:hypothetical protein BAT_3940 [Bacillus pumilus ATCC 7061]|nr:hypothetical protein BAT_3940 [Bacillus pumilus ATCC 7061]